MLRDSAMGCSISSPGPGLLSPRCSAIVQQFLRSSPDSMSSINPAACRTGPERVNRGVIRSITTPNASHQRPGSTLSAAANTADELFHKQRMLARWPPSAAQNPSPRRRSVGDTAVTCRAAGQAQGITHKAGTRNRVRDTVRSHDREFEPQLLGIPGGASPNDLDGVVCGIPPSRSSRRATCYGEVIGRLLGNMLFANSVDQFPAQANARRFYPSKEEIGRQQCNDGHREGRAGAGRGECGHETDDYEGGQLLHQIQRVGPPSDEDEGAGSKQPADWVTPQRRCYKKRAQPMP
jgi:hypothetical protein